MNIPNLVTLKPKVQLATFDRGVIKTNWKKINQGPMTRAGNIVRSNARGSIRRGNPSTPKEKRKPGNKTPKSWQPGKTPPFKMIYSVPNSLSTFDVAQIVGMVGFGGTGEPPPALAEYGGSAMRKVVIRKPPNAGLREDKMGGRDSKGRFKRSSIRLRDSKGRFAKARKAQWTRDTRTVRYRPRPYMNPALKRAKDKFPQLWKNSLGN